MPDSSELNLKSRFYESVLSNPSKIARFLQLAGIGLWELDVVSHESFWTEETFDVFGMEHHDSPIPFDVLIERIHPEDRPRVQEAVNQAFFKPIQIEYRITRQSGEDRFVRSQALVEMGPTSTHIIGTIQDITEQKRTELQLRSVFQSAKDAFIVMDCHGTVVSWNQGAEDIFGYTARERVGEKLLAIIPERFQQAHEHGIERYLATREKHLIDRTVELAAVCKNGREIPIELSLATFGVGDNLLFTGIIRDISERKENEMLLKFNKERYESLKRYNPNGICSLTWDGRVAGANPAFERLTGYSLDELREMNVIHTLFYPEDIELVTTTCVNPSVEDVELKIRNKSGNRVEVSLTNVPIVVEGDTIGVYLILMDITEQKRNQQKLLETERLYRLISEHSQDIITCTTPDGICSYVSPSIQEQLGYEPEEMIGRPSLAFYHPDDADYIAAIGRRILNGEDVDRFTCRIRLKNENYLWFDTTLKIVRDHEGHLLQVVGVGRNVSDRMELQESLEHAVRMAGLGHWEWDIPKGTIKYSEQMKQMLGIESGSELMTYEQVLGFVHPDDVELMDRSIKRSLETGNPYERLSRMVRTDGSIRYMHARGEVLFDEAGEPVKILGTSQDITRRRIIEQELQESNERYRRLVDNSLDAIGIFEDEKWVFMNHAGLQLFGASDESEVIGKNHHDFLHPDHHEECRKRVACMRMGESVGVVEQKWVKVNGDVFYAEVLGSPYSETAVQVVIRDVTERKRAEESVMNAEKLSAVGQLAAGIAHEIRNPLTALMGFTKILEEKAADDTKRYLTIMRDELDRIEGILNELLVLGKPQARHDKPTDVGLVIHEVTTLLGAEALINKVVIETQMEENVPAVKGDAHQLKQVFINVVKNAIEAMRGGGNLVLKLGVNQDVVMVECVDSGPGIPPERLERLGTPFFSTKEKGTGLGFMVSRRIIESHDGRLDVTSELGVGTTVRIALPAYRG